MKKHLLSAAIGLMCLSAAPAAMAYDLLVPTGSLGSATATSQLEDGKVYAIYDAHSARYAFRYETSSGAVHGTHQTPANVDALTAAYAWKAIRTESGNWQFQNLNSGKYMKNASHNTVMSTSATESEYGEFYVVPSADGATTFTISSGGTANTYPHWDGNDGGNYTMAGWNGSGHPYSFYELSEELGNATACWNVNLVFPGGETVKIGHVANGADYEYTEQYPNVFTTTEGSKTYANVTSTLNISANYAANAKPFRMVSARYTDRWANTIASGISTEVRTDQGSGAEVFLEIPASTEGRSKLFSIKGMGFFAEAANNANPTAIAANEESAGQFLITKTPQGAETLVSQNNIGFNLRDNHVAGWNGSDIGSRWFMVYDVDAFNANFTAYQANDNNTYMQKLASANTLKTEAEADEVVAASDEFAAFAANIATIEARRFGESGEKTIPAMLEELTAQLSALDEMLYGARYRKIVALGNAFAEAGISDADALSAWQTAVGTTPGTIGSEELAAAKTAFETFIPLASASLTGELHMTFLSPQRAAYIGQTNEGVKRGGIEGSRAFTLKPADGGVKIYHEYSNTYIKHPGADSQNITMTDVDNATVYTLDVFNANSLMLGLKANGATENREYLHSNNADSDVANVVRWQKGQNSSWIVTLVDEDQAAAEQLGGAQAYYHSLSFGEGIGTYSVAEADKAAVEAALAVGADASTAEKRAAANTLRNVNLVLNPPTAGFYRFKGAANDKYMSSTVVNNRMEMTTVNNGPETVFYYDGTYLAALSNGLVVGKFLANDRNTWQTMLSTNNNAGVIEFIESGEAGKYNLVASTGRYLYNANATVDCGSSDANGYRWEIQKVQYLPIPGSDQTFTTICSPVALDLSQKPGITASKAEIVDGKVSLTALQGNVIPANTPVVLHLTSGAQRDPNNHLAYLMVVDNIGENLTPIPTETGLNGNTLAIAKEASHRVLSNANYVAPSTDYTPGFCAYLTEGGEKMEMNFAAILGYIYSGKVYNIVNSDTAADRGYLRAQDGQEAIWTSKKAGNPSTNGNTAAEVAALAQSDVNFHWTVVTDSEGNHYLYNLGVNKFAAAFKANNGGGHGEFSWHFADAPTAVTLLNYDWNPGNTLNILGGQNNHAEKGNRPAGMMVINGNATPVVGVAGNSAQDGCGFIFTEVTNATLPADLPTAAQIAETKAAMAAEHDAFIELLATDETAAQEVGYFNSETLAAYMSNFTAAEADADAETKYYALMRAKNSVATPGYNSFAAEGKYRLQGANGQYYRAAAEKVGATSYETFAELADIDTEDLSFNWLATVNEDGTVTLTHTFQAPAGSTANPRNAMHRAPAGFEDFPVNFVENATPEYDGHGNITLPYAGETVTLRTATLPSDAQTTAIREVEAANNGNAEAIYDLQGRRLNRAIRGINIINGKKVLVK